MDARVKSIVATFVLAGCAGPAAHVLVAPPAQLQSGWRTTEHYPSGISLGVVPGWKAGSGLSPQDLIAFMPPASESGEGSTELGRAIEAQNETVDDAGMKRLREKGIMVNVVDGSRPIIGEERTRYYVLRKVHDGNISLASATEEEMDHLRGRGPDDPVSVKLPIGEAKRINSSTKTRGGDEETRISYVVVDGKTSYVLRFVATNNPSAIQSIADSVAETLRIKPSR